jgi:hypothetical protein
MFGLQQVLRGFSPSASLSECGVRIREISLWQRRIECSVIFARDTGDKNANMAKLMPVQPKDIEDDVAKPVYL